MFRIFRKSVPLRIHISTLFLTLVLTGCGVLSILFYKQSAEMVSTEVDKRLARILREVTNDFEFLMAPPAAVVNLISRHELVEATTLDQRLENTSFLFEAMQTSSEISSIFVGYPDGEFFLLRKLINAEDRAIHKAPENAVWAVQSIEYAAGGSTDKQYIFLDDKEQFIGNRTWQADYDPRARDWYKNTVNSTEMVRSNPYLFYSDRKIGMTFARSDVGKGVVAGADIRLETLSQLIKKHKVTQGSEVVLFDQDGQLVAYEHPERLIAVHPDQATKLKRTSITDLQIPALDRLFSTWQKDPSDRLGKVVFDTEQDTWVASVVQLNFESGLPIYLGMAIPYSELVAEVRHIINQSGLIALAIILALIPITLRIARVIARPLKLLADDVDSVRRFDFSHTAPIRSTIQEVDQLATTMDFMKQTISEFLSLIETINREKNFDSLLERIGNDTRVAAGAEELSIYLLDEDTGALMPTAHCGNTQTSLVEALPVFASKEDNPLFGAVKTNKVTNWHIRKNESHGMDALMGEPPEDITVWALPLNDRSNNCVGLICPVYRGAPDKIDVSDLEDRIGFVRRLSSLAGVTLETMHLIKKQKELFDAFIKLIAGSIDAKSPYTGGHCQRVPVIAKMLAEAACNDKEGAFKDFNLSEEEWEELHIAAWLHDCGKVTTPEFVVDKATKLETMYDRIHEVRMRFEVLWRDAEISCQKEIIAGGQAGELLNELEKTRKRFTEDFEFIAQCNEGGEFMAEEAVERLNSIARIKWQRNFDDRIGISWEEGKRKQRTPAQSPPVVETMLTDKEEHLIIRSEADQMPEDNPWGFELNEPEHLYNRGEVYNLEVKRGTLSEEERFKINDHIVQTIKMLKELPYPKHLRNVPEIAGGHHETMIGTGYPRKLSGDQMSLTAKMMVIADVFEALTASDRPYKKAKKLSEAVKIMGFMHKDGHFDSDLFHLFLDSGIYEEYAEQYLDADQIDEVVIGDYV